MKQCNFMRLWAILYNTHFHRPCIGWFSGLGGLEGGAYLPWEVLRPELPAAVQMFRRNLAGFNVTAPLQKKRLSPIWAALI